MRAGMRVRMVVGMRVGVLVGVRVPHVTLIGGAPCRADFSGFCKISDNLENKS